MTSRLESAGVIAGQRTARSGRPTPLTLGCVKFEARSGDSTLGLDRAARRVAPAVEQDRRRAQSTVLGEGTLACPRCDVPVAVGGTRLAVSSRLTCPFCGFSGRLSAFLSLAAPTRPARVIVRVVGRQPRVNAGR